MITKISSANYDLRMNVITMHVQSILMPIKKIPDMKGQVDHILRCNSLYDLQALQDYEIWHQRQQLYPEQLASSYQCLDATYGYHYLLSKSSIYN